MKGICGALSAQRAAGAHYQTVINRVEFLREQERRRVGTYGIAARELRYALDCEGWRMRRVFRNRRVRLKTLARRITKGRWIFLQSHHWFGVASGKDLRRLARAAPEALVLGGWLVHRKRTPALAQKAAA